MSGTAEHGRDAVGKCQQEVEQRNRSRLHHAVVDDLRIAVECRNQDRCSSVDDKSDQFGNNDRAENAEPRSLFRTVILFCTKILADECGQRHRKAGDRQEGKALNFRIRTAACHRHFSECIDVCLHENVCNRDN